jgi:hypothetical protein
LRLGLRIRVRVRVRAWALNGLGQLERLELELGVRNLKLKLS